MSTQENTMTTHHTAAATPAIRYVRLSEVENQRAIERIEPAERDTPFCLCGASMVAAAHDGSGSSAPSKGASAAA
jgi:hypothetical protein